MKTLEERLMEFFESPILNRLYDIIMKSEGEKGKKEFISRLVKIIIKRFGKELK